MADGSSRLIEIQIEGYNDDNLTQIQIHLAQNPLAMNQVQEVLIVF